MKRRGVHAGHALSAAIPMLGIDFDGVIVPMVGRTRDESPQCPGLFFFNVPQPGAIENIQKMVTSFDEKNVWIMSKAGPRIEELTHQWFQMVHFFELTGMNAANVRFCRECPEKALICKELGITHFIDDRIHFMQILKNTVRYLYLFGDKTKNRTARNWTTLVGDWHEASEMLERDLACDAAHPSLRGSDCCL